jgi:Fe-S oxidoreductase
MTTSATQPETNPAIAAAASPTRAQRYGFNVEGEIPDDRVERFAGAFEQVLRYSRGYRPLLDAYAHASANCSRCVVTCPVYLASGDPRDIPCRRTHLLLDAYCEHFTPGGRLKARLFGGRSLSPAIVDEMAESFWRCTACRRCHRECPLGIDHGLVTHLGRYILSLAGIAPRALEVSVREQLEGETHNTSRIPRPALDSNLEFLTEELEEAVGVPITFPVDEPGREFVFFCAVSDYLMEPETLMGNAAVLYAAGDADRWTIGSENFDAINYGLFYSDWHLERIIKRLVKEVQRLEGTSILVGECGHASRSARDFVPIFGGPDPPPVISFIEYTLERLESERIRLDPDVVTEKVTYHDPCNMARSGWIVDQPRRILRSFVPNFVEMSPGGRNNYCCGGGGGLVSIDEIHEFRMETAGRIKAEQLACTGAEICIAPCANCKKQLKELVQYYDIPCQVMGLHDLILRALHVPGGIAPRDRDFAATPA